MTADHGSTGAPIIGKEDLGDRSRPARALAELYQAFNARDLALMGENWTGRDAWRRGGPAAPPPRSVPPGSRSADRERLLFDQADVGRS